MLQQWTDVRLKDKVDKSISIPPDDVWTPKVELTSVYCCLILSFSVMSLSYAAALPIVMFHAHSRLQGGPKIETLVLILR